MDKRRRIEPNQSGPSTQPDIIPADTTGTDEVVIVNEVRRIPNEAAVNRQLEERRQAAIEDRRERRRRELAEDDRSIRSIIAWRDWAQPMTNDARRKLAVDLMRLSHDSIDEAAYQITHMISEARRDIRETVRTYARLGAIIAANEAEKEAERK